MKAPEGYMSYPSFCWCSLNWLSQPIFKLNWWHIFFGYKVSIYGRCGQSTMYSTCLWLEITLVLSGASLTGTIEIVVP